MLVDQRAAWVLPAVTWKAGTSVRAPPAARATREWRAARRTRARAPSAAAARFARPCPALDPTAASAPPASEETLMLDALVSDATQKAFIDPS